MNKPNWLQANMSVGNILSIATVLLSVGGSLAVMTWRLDAIDKTFTTIAAERDKRATEIDGKFAKLEAAYLEIPQIAYRVTAAEAALKQIENRIDNGFSSFSARLDRGAEATSAGLQAIGAAIGALDTRVAVLTQRLESREERRTELDRRSAVR